MPTNHLEIPSRRRCFSRCLAVCALIAFAHDLPSADASIVSPEFVSINLDGNSRSIGISFVYASACPGGARADEPRDPQNNDQEPSNRPEWHGLTRALPGGHSTTNSTGFGAAGSVPAANCWRTVDFADHQQVGWLSIESLCSAAIRPDRELLRPPQLG
jgi:hypothetical protein